MLLGHELTVYCDRPKRMLEDLMQEAVDRYLSSRPRVSVIEKNNRSIMLKIPINLKSWGEKLRISVKAKSFHVQSESATFIQAFDWGKNYDNVRAMCNCVENVISRYNER